MRKLFYGISLIGILLSFPTLLIGQILDPEIYSYDCIENENEPFVDTTCRGLYESRKGRYHSPHGEIRFLVAFIELSYANPDEDPSLYGSDEWRPGELPSWRDSLLSTFSPDGISNCYLTKYYQNASSNNHIVLGDYLVAPTNGGVFQVNTVNGEVGTSSIVNAINQQMGDTIMTAHGLNSISYFDNWTLSDTVGIEKMNVGDGHWDYVVFVIRNSIEPANSCGSTSFDNLCLLGHDTDAYTKVCTNKEIPTQIIRHEYAHMLLGGNNFHTAGGGWGYGYGDYWIPQTSGWGLLGLYGCSLWCWNAWDRQRLGWIDPNSTYEISARNQNGIEVDGDLDATDPNDAGIYVLRDFVTTGDAIRIKLPYINSDKEYQEWLWIENHQGVKNNDNEFDQWQYQDKECVEDFEPGLMMYIQINNDIRISDNYNYIYSSTYNHANYTRVLTANGLWDRKFMNDSVYANCVNYNDKVRPFVRFYDNPFTGTEDQSFYANDNNNDNSLSKSDQLKIWVEYDGSNYHSHLYSLGHSSHSFNLQGNSKIGIGTNPSTATLINMVGENSPYSNAKNLRNTYLNGISVEMLEQLPNGDIKIRVRFDDVDVENNVRWCSDNIILNPIATDSGYSLNIKEGKTIRLDQGLTPTRMTNPVMFNNQKIFASPTTLTIMPNAKLHLEPLSKIILENGSKMHLSEGSSCVIESAGNIEVKDGTVLQLDDCSSMYINGTGKLIVRNGAELRISPNAILSFQNGINNIVLEEGVVIPDGYVNPISLVNRTDIVIHGNRTFDGATIKVYKKILVENNAILTLKSSSVHFADENSGIIIKPGGKLVIDGGELTSVCSDKQWQGIEVWGVDSLNQNIINGQCQQAYLVLKNGAIIENAICAVNLCNPADEHGSGGVVQATDAVFRNNSKSIRATDYSNYNQNPNVETANVSSFNQCSFTVDEDYISDETFYSHVELSEVDGIKFYACSFSVDNDVQQVSSSSSAITAYNAGFSVESLCDSPVFPCPESSKIPSSFDGFNKAVSVTNSGGVSRTFSISGSSFNNNETGIYAENTGYATIIMNDFMVGTKGACNYGIYLNHVTNFCIEENTFSRDKYVITLNKIYGIAVKNSASFNDIYLNHFSNLYCGVVAIGSNKIPSHTNYDFGLTYTCNTNYGNTNDIGVLRDGIYGNIDGEQGSNSVGAGNTFSASNYHFYHNGINHSKVKYYYHGSGNKIPTRRYNVTTESAISDNDCLSHYSAIPPGPGGELMSVITTDSLGSMYTLTRVTGNLVRNSLNEEERDYDELREWLGKANDMNSDRMIVASYIQQGDFDNASSYAKTLVKKYALQGAELDEHLDYMEIISLHESLHETQRSVKQLTDYEKAMLEDMAENGVGGSQLMARSILDESRGTQTIIISSCPTIPTYGASVRGESEEITEPTSDKGLKVEVSPNPATSSVEISYVLPEKEKTATFVLTNTLGVNVLTTELEGNNGVATINLDNIPSGIYFYTVRSGDDVMTGKLVVE